MQAKNEISEELRSLSVVIDAISRQMPYGLPEGYFEDFAGRLMIRIRGGENPFQVPEGYFEGFAGGVLARIKASQGAAGGQSIGSADGITGRLAEPSVSEELAMLSPLLSQMDRRTPYQAPEGYFGELVPILAGLQNKSLYEVPEGYFDGLAGAIAARVAQPETDRTTVLQPAPAKIVSFGRSRSWWRYSAAAVVAGLILTIGWLRLHTVTPGQSTGIPDIASSLIKVSDQDIQNYLDNHNVTTLAEPDSIANSTAALNIDDNDVKNLLGDVPDGELKQYMEEHVGTKEVATN